VQQERDEKQKIGAAASRTAVVTGGSAPACGPDASAGYRTYIASARWRRQPSRLAELEASEHRCRICDRGPPDVRLEVHHRRYRNLGRERVGDLTCLCADCHRVNTAELRRRRYEGRHRWRGADVTRPLLRSFGPDDGRHV
jgi:hypothetical protein